MIRKIAVCILALVMLAGCSQKSLEKEKDSINPGTEIKNLEDIPEDFSLQAAKDAGMLVIEDMTITSGIEQWNNFLDSVQSGRPSQIMITRYYELGDEDNYSPELYSEIKETYPQMYVFLLSYDGNTYTFSYYEGDKLYTCEYPYLIERIGKLNNAAYADHFFALVKDKSLTYHDISWSLFSSQSTEWVDFEYVFLESITLKQYEDCQPGTYQTEDEEAFFMLDENCEFVFARQMAANYVPMGRYYIEDDNLILYVSEDEKYCFEINGDGVFTFVSGEGAEGLVAAGTKFLLKQ